ncbi:MAG: SOS response-associated peptidase family protein, partial [Steroidobacteraceae bacterium]
MCGRVIQSSGPLRYAIVDGMNVRDSLVHNYPPRWNVAPSQDLLVIRRHHQTGEVPLEPLRWGLVPYWCRTRKAGASRSTLSARPCAIPPLLPGGWLSYGA